ncbi:hypothetical protein ACIOD2_32305 [Amycolatopsis sp. NPDC088138]|uniref:hypothetical protein n=1 Tax=Amycolatopsis sp. NPDC088138 TaxID=3363938 RepID=UPI0037F5E2FF
MTKEQASAAVELCFGEPLPDGTFRQWKSRGRIHPATPGGSLYFLSDVLALAAVRARHKLEVASKPKPPPKPRASPSRPPKGADNAHWKGDEAGYHAVHYRLRRMIGRPNECSCCGTRDEGSRYDWALNWEGNPTVQDGPHGQYSTNLDDYVRMCRPCHRQMDARHARDIEFGRCG